MELSKIKYQLIITNVPMLPMFTVLEKIDWSGKTVMPFFTHEGSGAGDTHGEIVRLEPNATVTDVLSVRGGDTINNQTDTITSWLEKLKK